jgi:excisionase family DNA binding protein
MHATLMTPAEVAALFSVSPKTVTRWARTGKISCIRTLGGHRRFDRAQMEDFAVHGYDPDRRGAA